MRLLPLVCLLFAAACGQPECADDELLSASGECVFVDPDREAVLPDEAEGLPPCELAAPGNRLDPARGCADGACSDTPYGDWVAALGQPDECTSGDGYAFCDWQGGAIDTFFDDNDNDTVPDDGALSAGVFLNGGWSGASSDGLALGISMRCWLEVWSNRILDYETTDGVISEVHFDNPSVIVSDSELLEEPDGFADRVSLFGP